MPKWQFENMVNLNYTSMSKLSCDTNACIEQVQAINSYL